MTQEQSKEFSKSLMELAIKYNCQDALMVFSHESKVARVRVCNTEQTEVITLLISIVDQTLNVFYEKGLDSKFRINYNG